jgi:hypothetical protein
MIRSGLRLWVMRTKPPWLINKRNSRAGFESGDEGHTHTSDGRAAKRKGDIYSPQDLGSGRGAARYCIDGVDCLEPSHTASRKRYSLYDDLVKIHFATFTGTLRTSNRGQDSNNMTLAQPTLRIAKIITSSITKIATAAAVFAPKRRSPITALGGVTGLFRYLRNAS